MTSADYASQSITDVMISLGETFEFNVTLAAESIEEIIVTAAMVETAQVAIGPSSAFSFDEIQNAPSFDRDNALPKTVVRHKQTQKPTGMVLLAHPAVSIFQKEDYAAMTVLDAMSSGYSYPGGWLHNELRGEGLVYFVHAFQISGPSPGYFSILSQTRPDKIDEVVERIKKNVARAKAGRISKEEFDTAVQMVLSLHAQDNTTIGEQAGQVGQDR